MNVKSHKKMLLNLVVLDLIWIKNALKKDLLINKCIMIFMSRLVIVNMHRFRYLQMEVIIKDLVLQFQNHLIVFNYNLSVYLLYRFQY